MKLLLLLLGLTMITGSFTPATTTTPATTAPATTTTAPAGYRVSGIPTRQVTAKLGSTIWIDRPQYSITNMPQELIGSTLFQPATPYVDISTIEVFSTHEAIIYVGVHEEKEGGLMEILPMQGWTLRDGWFVEWNLGARGRLHKIWSKQIDAGKTISFTTSKNGMTFAIFISEGNQEVIDKLTMLENKIANLETENENIIELMKVTVLRSCAEYSHYGLQTSGRYMIDPDGKLTGQEPFQVYCDFSSGATEVMHDTEKVTEIEHCHNPGCYHKKISYINGLTTEPINMTQILSLMELSESCTQDIRYNCTLAPLEHNGVNYAWWKDRHGEDNIYFTGSHYNQHVCDCHYSPDGCVDAAIEKNQCNCNAYRPVATSDTGTITNMSALPIMEFFAGGLEVQKIEVGSFQIGRLKCYGEKEVETATSCSSLKKEGVMTSGYYNIKPLGSKHVKLVFCDMKTDTYNDVLQVDEVRDSSPLGTILAWVPRPETSLNAEVLPDGWLPCDGTTITKGPWAGGKTPDLNTVGAFLRGSTEDKNLEMEEDQVQDHKHVDSGHSHSCSASSQSSSHHHSFKKTNKHSYDKGHWSGNSDEVCADYNDMTYDDSSTGSATVSVTTSCSTGSHSSGLGGVTSSYRRGSETRPRNMKVNYVIRCW